MTAEQHLASEDVAEQPGRQRDDAAQLGNQLDREQERRVGHVLDAADHAVGADSEDLHGGKGDQRHGQRHVEIGVRGAEERHQHLVRLLFVQASPQ